MVSSAEHVATQLPMPEKASSWVQDFPTDRCLTVRQTTIAGLLQGGPPVRMDARSPKRPPNKEDRAHFQDLGHFVQIRVVFLLVSPLLKSTKLLICSQSCSPASAAERKGCLRNGTCPCHRIGSRGGFFSPGPLTASLLADPPRSEGHYCTHGDQRAPRRLTSG